MGPFLASYGKKYILVAVNYMLEWLQVQALPINDTNVVIKFLKMLFSCFGMPKALISDGGTHCCNDQLAKVLKFGVHRRFATPYHPKRSGKTNRLEQIKKNGLKTSMMHCRNFELL